MKINAVVIKALKPCADRFNNFLFHYAKFNGDLKEFILLENITYSDKVWVVTRLFTKEQNIKWSLLCAGSVLSIFETQYSEDLRPRKALEAAENYLNEPSEENRIVAAYAANAAGAINARKAIYSNNAAHSAAYVAYATVHDSIYSASAAHSAAHAATYTGGERDIQEQVNLLFMVEAEGE